MITFNAFAETPMKRGDVVVFTRSPKGMPMVYPRVKTERSATLGTPFGITLHTVLDASPNAVSMNDIYRSRVPKGHNILILREGIMDFDKFLNCEVNDPIYIYNNKLSLRPQKLHVGRIMDCTDNRMTVYVNFLLL
jgi:hypothetical protein